MPVCRLLWWFGLNIGRQRANYFGTFGVSVYSALGAESLHPLSPLTSTLNYGVIAADGTTDVRVVYDHRVTDGATVARALARLEEVLNTTIRDELTPPPPAPRRLDRPGSGRRPGRGGRACPTGGAPSGGVKERSRYREHSVTGEAATRTLHIKLTARPAPIGYEPQGQPAAGFDTCYLSAGNRSVTSSPIHSSQRQIPFADSLNVIRSTWITAFMYDRRLTSAVFASKT